MHYYEPMVQNGDWGFGMVMMLLWFAFFVVIAFVVIRLVRGSSLYGQETKTPLEIAEERYAKGDITKAQFEQLKKDLK